MSSAPVLLRRAPQRRDTEAVMPLELFFDLVFVLAITQTTALMAHEPTWKGLVKGMLVLAIMWWSWVGYSWLTSVLDPEDGIVRLALAGAMAALLVCAICIPNVFEDDGLLFACGYGVVRVMHIVLFRHGSRDNPALRASINGLAVSTAIATALLIGASFFDGWVQGAIWAVAVTLDFAGALLSDASGWELRPHHFAERHGLIVIIALGESIVAVGAGASGLALTAGVVLAAVLGTLLAFALWWLYFDVIAVISTRRLAEAESGLVQNTLARDAYSYLHLPMVAGIVLVALGLKKTIGHVDEPLKLVPAVALLGGFALYLAAHIGFRWRIVSILDREQFPNARRLNRERLLWALVLLAAIPLSTSIDAIVLLTAVTVAAALLIAAEVRRQGDFRRTVRAQTAGHEG